MSVKMDQSNFEIVHYVYVCVHYVYVCVQYVYST